MLKLFQAEQSSRSNNALQVGDPAPDFTLPDQINRPVHFADLLGKGAVVLFFYPKDHSAGCTAEACAFRDSYEAFTEAGATVIGISADSAESHQGFASRHRLPFILLSDHDGSVQKLYGVEKTFGLLRARTTFIIDRQGIVRHVFSSQLNIQKHVTDALDIVQALLAEPKTESA